MNADEATDEIHRHLSNLMQALTAYVDHADGSNDAVIFRIAKHLTEAEHLITGLGVLARPTAIDAKPES